MEIKPGWNEEGAKVFDEIIRFVSVLVFHMIEYFSRKFGVIDDFFAHHFPSRNIIGNAEVAWCPTTVVHISATRCQSPAGAP